VSTIYDTDSAGNLTAGPFNRTPESFWRDLGVVGIDCAANPTAQSCMDRANLYRFVVQPYCIGCHNAFVPFASSAQPGYFTNMPAMSYTTAPSRYGWSASWPVSSKIGSTVDLGGSNPFMTYQTFDQNFAAIWRGFLANGRMPASEHALAKFHAAKLTDDGANGTALQQYDVKGNARGPIGSTYTASSLLRTIMLAPTTYNATECTVDSDCGDPSNSGRICAMTSSGHKACMNGCSSSTTCPNPPWTTALNRTQCVAAPSDGLPHAPQTCQACGRLGQPPCSNAPVCLEGSDSNGTNSGGTCVKPIVLSVYRPSSRQFFARDRSGHVSVAQGSGPGTPVLGDFNADGRTDYGLFGQYRPKFGTPVMRWYTRRMDDTPVPAPDAASLGSDTIVVRSNTQTTDVPLAADIDGDHATDEIVYKRATGTFEVRYAMNGALASFQVTSAWSDAVPMIGDFDRDGRDDLVVFRPNDNDPYQPRPHWYLRYSGNGSVIDFQHPRALGATTTSVRPVLADFDNDQIPDLGLVESRFHAQFGVDIYIWNVWSWSWWTPWITEQEWGGAFCGASLPDVPVPADYLQTGTAQLAVWRPCEGNWFILTPTNQMIIEQWGTAGDIPLTNYRAPW
jgi:hypothetical protein